MKKLAFIFFVIISFCSCDGRYKLKNSKVEAVKAFNAKTQNEPILKFIPEESAQIEIDTLINNKTHIKIISKLSHDNVVMVPSQTSQSNITLAYKNTVANISVLQKDHAIFHKNIDKSWFENKNHFWKHAVLESVWVNQEQSLNDLIVFDIVFKNPLLKTDKLCYLIVDSIGNHKIKFT